MSYLLIVLAIIAGSLIVGLTGAYFMRARNRESAEAAPPSNLASAAAPVPIALEVKAIGEKIEQAMADQRLQGETQRQLLAQKLDGVRESVESQRTHVEGLRGELRHEVRRRDAEIAEIREQLGSIQRAAGLPAAPRAALPPADEQERPALPHGPSAALDVPAPWAPEEPAAPSVDASKAPSPFEPAAFEDVAFEPIAFEGAPEAASPSADPFGEVALGDAPPTPPAEDAPSFEEETFVETTFARPAEDPGDPFASAPSYGAADAPAGGDSVSAGDVFESWSPEPPTPPSRAPRPAPPQDTFSEATFEPVSFDAPAASPAPAASSAPASTAAPAETAWIARSAPPSPDAPVFASADDFLFSPISTPPDPVPQPPSPAEADEPGGLVDLDALAGPASEPAEAPPLVEPPADAAPSEATEPEPGPMETAPAEAPTAEVGPPEAVEPPAPPPAPAGAEDLTVISTIDEATQQRLYQEGVLTLEAIAQWGRGEARRISSRVDVSENVIMNQWVFEAQAALFNRYSQQVGQ